MNFDDDRAGKNVAKKALVYFLISILLWPGVALAGGYVSPVTKWTGGGYQGGSYSANIATPDIDDATLPGLKGGFENLAEGIRAGEVEIRLSDKTLVVDQKTNKILAVWDSFDIGKDASVTFNQPDSSSVAVNLIDQASPSAILGNLSANGSVYLINPNGVIFGENARVDARGLVAAAMELNGFDMDHQFATEAEKQSFLDESLLTGIASGDAFLVNAKDIAEGTDDLPRIVIKQGATITSDKAPILMAGPEVINDGELTSDGGQVILAGSRQDVYLAVSDRDRDLRGYLVEVDSGDTYEQAVDAEGNLVWQTDAEGNELLDVDGNRIAALTARRGSVVNAGTIQSNLGNVTLIASEILQAGKIKATTAVDVNGSVRILARDRAEVLDTATLGAGINQYNALYFDSNPESDVFEERSLRTQAPTVGAVAIGTEAGKVVLTEGSEISVAMQAEDINGDIKTATDSLQQNLSRIQVEGKEVTLATNSQIVAPGAQVTIRARENPIASLELPEPDSEAFIRLEQDALIDVSGATEAELDADRNAIEVFVTSTEIKDHPDQKEGDILRQRLFIDVREGTELLDWETQLDTIEKGIAERLMHGGNVSLMTTGSAELGSQAGIDVSGGHVNYKAGEFQTSRVCALGQCYDIADAPAGVPVSGVLEDEIGQADHPKWRKRDSFSAMQFFTKNKYQLITNQRESYLEGGNAGQLSIIAPDLELAEDASLLATTEPGLFQRSQAAPKQGQVSLDLSRFVNDDVNVSLRSAQNDEPILGSEEPEDLSGPENELIVSTELIEQSGAGRFSILTTGDITLETDSNLKLGHQDALVLAGDQIHINSDIRTLGGDVSFTAESLTQIQGTIDTSGVWTNDYGLPVGSLEKATTVDAGDISVNSALHLHEEVALIANAGAWIDGEQSVTLGKAGDINVGAGALDPELGVSNDIRGQFESLDFGSGGTLTITADSLEIDGRTANESVLGQTLLLSDQFFSQNKVNQYVLQAMNGDAVITEDASLNLDSQQFQLKPVAGINTLASSESISTALDQRPLLAQDKLGGSLTLEAYRGGINRDELRGNVLIEQGASIQGVAESALELVADRSIMVDGDIRISGGSLQATLGAEQEQEGSIENVIGFGADATIDFSASAIEIPSSTDAKDLRIIESGRVDLQAIYGFVALHPESEIRLAGGVFEEVRKVGNESISVFTPVKSGRFDVLAERGVSLYSAIDFGESDSNYRGGDISLTLDANKVEQKSPELAPPEKLRLLVGDRGESDRYSFIQGETEFFTDLEGTGRVSQQFLEGSNLANLSLKIRNTLDSTQGALRPVEHALNLIEISDDTRLSARESVFIDTPTLDLNERALEIDAPYVLFGPSSNDNFPIDPVSSQSQALDQTGNFDAGGGFGTLLVESRFTDFLGDFSVNGDGFIDIQSEQGVRFRSINRNNSILPGGVQVHADVSIRAPKMWVSTLSDMSFSSDGFFSYEHYGENSDRQVSAAGKLGIFAQDVYIDSQIELPFGQISLDAVNSLALGDNAELSVAGKDTVLFGRVQAEDFSWYYSTTQEADFNTVNRFDNAEDYPLNKSIDLSAEEISVAAGAKHNVAGGGDVIAREFVAGLQGTNNFLQNNAYEERFALVPSHTTGILPHDLAEVTGSGIPMGSQIELHDVNGIAQGRYTILPISYALLPDAVIVTPGAGGVQAKPLQSYIAPNGKQTVSGRVVGLDQSTQSPWQSFQIESNLKLGKYARYDVLSANDYFNSGHQGARPADNGGVSVRALNDLDFNGQILSSADSDTSSYFDISSDNNILVQGLESDGVLAGQSGFLQVSSELFGRVDVDSILLGGQRSQTAGGWRIEEDDLSSRVVFDAATLSADELVVAAGESIELLNGTQLSGNEADAAARMQTWQMDGQGATLLLSNSSGSRLNVQGHDVTGTQVLIDSQSVLQGSAAISIAHEGLQSLGTDQVHLTDSGLQFYAANVEVGTEADADSGNISTELLSTSNELVLNAQDAIRFDADLSVTGNNIALSADSVFLADNVDVSLTAQEGLQLATDNTVSGTLSSENSSISLSGRNIQLGRRDTEAVTFLLDAESVSLTATEAMEFSGDLSILGGRDAGEFRISTPYLGSGHSSARLAMSSESDLLLLGGGESLPSIEKDEALGSSVALTGQNITLDTYVDARAGQFTAFAAAGDITLQDRARINLSSFSRLFAGQEEQGIYGSLQFKASGDVNIGVENLYYDAAIPGSHGQIVLGLDGELRLSSPGESVYWGEGTDLTIQAGRLGADTLATLHEVNAAGANGNLAVVLRQQDQLDLAIDLSAQSLLVANSGGELLVSGALSVADALTLYARDDLALTSTAELAAGSMSDNSSVQVRSAEGTISIQDETSLALNSDLSLFLSANAGAVNGSDVSVDAEELNGHQLKAYLRTTKQTTTLTKAALNTAIAESVLNMQTFEADLAGRLVGSAESSIRPHLDIHSTSSLLVSDPGTLDLITLRNDSADAGHFSMRAAESITLDAGISDGVRKIGVVVVGPGAFETQYAADIDGVVGNPALPWQDNLVLQASESSNMEFVTGSRADSVLGYADLLHSHDFEITSDHYIRSGSGDIRLDISGDLRLEENAFIASYGRTSLDENGAPSLGEMPFFSLDTAAPKTIFDNYGGIGFDAGDINVQARGDIQGLSDNHSWTHYLKEIHIEEFEREFLPGMPVAYLNQHWVFAALDATFSGVHSIGGGQVNVNAGGDISNVGFSTPRNGFVDAELVDDPEGLGDDTRFLINGGSLAVNAGGDVAGLTLQNDGGEISLFARGSVLGFGEQERTLFIGAADSQVTLAAGGEMVLDAIVNTSMALYDQSGFNVLANNLFSNPETTTAYYFDGYSSSALSLTSYNKDVLLARNLLAAKATYDDALFNRFVNEAEEEGYLLTHNLLPSTVNIKSLGGSVYFNSIDGASSAQHLFPSKDNRLSILAKDNIEATGQISLSPNTSSEGITINIPDFPESDLPDLSRAMSSSEVISLFDAAVFSTKQGGDADEQLNHGSQGIDRPEDAIVKVATIEGNIGSESDPFRLRIPMPLDMYAGGSIINTGVRIQHSRAEELSAIIAEGDIYYPFQTGNEGILKPSSSLDLGITIGGPGDLLIRAGGDIDLGSSYGIRSVGNKHNPLLDVQGAGLHVYAGVSEFGNLNALVPQTIEGNPNYIGLDLGDRADLATTIDLFIATIESGDVPVEVYENLIELMERATGISFLDVGEMGFAEDFLDAVAKDVGLEVPEYILAQLVDTPEVILSDLDEGELSAIDLDELKTKLEEELKGDSFSVLKQLTIDYIEGLEINSEIALALFATLDTGLQQRIATESLSNQQLSLQGWNTEGASKLFADPSGQDIDFDSAEERSELFQDYFLMSNAFVTLQTMQESRHVGRLMDYAALEGVDGMQAFSSLPLYQQINLANGAYRALPSNQKVLVAESIMNAQVKQSGIEGSLAGNSVSKFERGYVAQRMLFGGSYDYALYWMDLKADILALKSDQNSSYQRLQTSATRYQNGLLSEQEFVDLFNQIAHAELSVNDAEQLNRALNDADDIDSLNLGGPGSQSLSSLDSVFDFWESDSGVSFDIASMPQNKGNINMLFSTIQTRSGGDVNLYAPNGSIDVGESRAQVEALFITNPPAENELGVLAFESGDIHSVVADAFNVNESRAIPLGGGDISLWSAFGNIDAGRGAKTAIATPPTGFVINQQTGGIEFVTESTVSGSGISTREAKGVNRNFATPEDRFEYSTAGAGKPVLVTPFGVVDAGEAGIQSAGDLFLAAQKVLGADNISAVGISAGVPVTTSVGTDIGGLGSAIDAATESVQASAEEAATASASQGAAFVTIELL